MFLACQWQRFFGAMGGSLWLGIDAVEIRAVMQCLRVKRKRWPEVFSGVRVMVNAVRGDLNEREQEK